MLFLSLACLAVLLVSGGLFAVWASPQWMLAKVGTAARSGDRHTLETLIDFKAIRTTLADDMKSLVASQVRQNVLESGDGFQMLFSGVATEAAQGYVGDFIDQAVTPSNLERVVDGESVWVTVMGEANEVMPAAAAWQGGPTLPPKSGRYLSFSRYEYRIGPDLWGRTFDVQMRRTGPISWQIDRVEMDRSIFEQKPPGVQQQPQVVAAVDEPETGEFSDPRYSGFYPVVRGRLFADGYRLAGEDVENPHHQHRELDCWQQRTDNQCRAVFKRTDSDGWTRYLIVEADRGSLRTSRADAPYTVEGHPAEPPPPPADAPSLPDDYAGARQTLLAAGYSPRVSAEPFLVCREWFEGDEPMECEPTEILPEVESCSGTGRAHCSALWNSPDGRVLEVTTAGEPQPGGVWHVEWQ